MLQCCAEVAWEVESADFLPKDAHSLLQVMQVFYHYHLGTCVRTFKGGRSDGYWQIVVHLIGMAQLILQQDK